MKVSPRKTVSGFFFFFGAGETCPTSRSEHPDTTLFGRCLFWHPVLLRLWSVPPLGQLGPLGVHFNWKVAKVGGFFLGGWTCRHTRVIFRAC